MTSNAFSHNGDTPVFVEPLADGLPNSDLIEDAFKTNRSAGKPAGAIITVDIYRSSADYPKILEIGKNMECPFVPI